MVTRRVESRVLGSRAQVPVIEIDAGTPGPTLVVSGNLHGDELTGIGACHALDRLLVDRLSRGRVVLLPTLNPGGLARGTRGLPDSDLDPNRAFPGRGRGNAAEQHSASIWKLLRHIDPTALIDIHTDSSTAMPYCLVDRVLSSDADLSARSAALGEATGLSVLREYATGTYRAFGLERSLSGAVVNHYGVPAVTIEVGPRRALDPIAIDIAVQCVLGVLGHLGLVDHAPRHHQSRVDGGPWRRDNASRTVHLGLLVPLARPGVVLDAGAVICETRHLDGRVIQAVQMPSRGFVVGYPDSSWLAPGITAATLAVAD